MSYDPIRGDDHPNCLVEKFGSYRELSEEETAFLAALQEEERSFESGTEVIVQGQESDFLYVLRRGWAYSYKDLSNGERQVLEFLLPGDFLGVREFAFNRALNFVVLSTDARLCPFPKTRIHEIFDGYPNLAATMVQISTREQALLVERIVSLGSRTAYQRVLHQILELLIRLRTVKLTEGRRFHLPISQAVLADAMGISKIHVNRTLSKLRKDRILSLEKRTVEILEFRKAVEISEFEDYYLSAEGMSEYLE